MIFKPFAITNTIPRRYSIDFLIVAGGGGGMMSGGGAGGLLSGSIQINTKKLISVNVGMGGTGSKWPSIIPTPTSGSASSFDYLFVPGGGTKFVASGSGGSGAGGTALPASGPFFGGLGIVPYGFPGGTGSFIGGNGGGGGSSQKGADAGGYNGAKGGSGSAWLDGKWYGGGGGGAGVTGVSGSGGYPYGGNGGASSTATGSNATGYGGGGGGGGLDSALGGNGYQGIIIIRYTSGSVQDAIGGTVTSSGSYTYHTFTSSVDYYTGTI